MMTLINISINVSSTAVSLKDTIMQHKTMIFMLLAMVAYMTFMQAHAGSDGGEFDKVYDKITGWAQGTLGRILALTCIVVGTAFTISRGTLIYAVIGVAMCLVLYNAPTVIEGILTATAPLDMPAETVAKLPELTNGLR